MSWVSASTIRKGSEFLCKYKFSNYWLALYVENLADSFKRSSHTDWYQASSPYIIICCTYDCRIVEGCWLASINSYFCDI